MEVLRAHGFSAAAFPGVTGTAAADLKQTDRQLEELGLDPQRTTQLPHDYRYPKN